MYSKLKIFVNREIEKFRFDSVAFRYTFAFSIVIGIIVHMIILATGLHNHDSIVLPYSDYGWLISQGKWFATPFASLDGDYDIYYLSGVIGIAGYALAAALIASISEVSDRRVLSLIGLSVVTSPSVATALIYHGADYFGMSFFVSVVGAYLVITGGIIHSIIGIILVCVSVGAYQANVSVALMVFIIEIIRKVVDEKDEISVIIIKAIKYIFATAIATIVYYAILKIYVRYLGVELSSYKGINDMSNVLSPEVILNSSIIAYKNFISYYSVDALGLYSGKYFIAGVFVLLGAVLTSIICIFKCLFEKKIVHAVVIIVLIYIGVPLCANAIGILSQNSSFYQITVEPFSLVLPLLLIFSYRSMKESKFKWNHLLKMAFLFIFLSTLYLNWCWIKEENTAYQEISLINHSFDSKMTILVSNIQSAEGYTDDTEVVIIGEAPFNFLSSTGVLNTFEEQLYTLGYGFASASGEIYHENILASFLANKYSIKMKIDDSDNTLDLNRELIDTMEVYPNDGSIKNIDGQIVVKLSENY